jgi:uridine kinase
MDQRFVPQPKPRSPTRFKATVKPLADLDVLPSQTRTTTTVLGTDTLDWFIGQIFRELRDRALL